MAGKDSPEREKEWCVSCFPWSIACVDHTLSYHQLSVHCPVQQSETTSNLRCQRPGLRIQELELNIEPMDSAILYYSVGDQTYFSVGRLEVGRLELLDMTQDEILFWSLHLATPLQCFYRIQTKVKDHVMEDTVDYGIRGLETY